VPNINPLGKIPVLVLDDETPLFDSRVIVEYIDNVTPNNKLFPPPTATDRGQALGSPGRWPVRRRRRRPARRQAPGHPEGADWIARQRDKVARSLEFMAEALGDKSFCMGTHISMADWPWAPLGYLCFRFPDIAWQEATPTWPSCTTS
jgi:glutathione S-transferase